MAFIPGGPGDDVLPGTPDADVIEGYDGNDRINAGEGEDVVRGGRGNDVIDGERGNGGPGMDIMDGGAGADRYLFIPSSVSTTQVDRVYFSATDDDVIDLSMIDAVTGGGDDMFSFLGTGAFTGLAGQLRYEATGSWSEGDRSGAVYRVSGDLNGDGVADFHIDVNMLGTDPLGPGDFVL